MRKVLKKDEGSRKRFRARFIKTGKKTGYTGYSEETILLQNIRDVITGLVVADHLWFAYTKGFQGIKLNSGCEIEFDARVKEYTKGYVNKKAGVDQRRRDYKLSNPTKINLV